MEPGFLSSARKLPASSTISSVVLDRGLFMLSGLFVMIAGLLTLMFVPTVSAWIADLCLCDRNCALSLLFLAVRAFQRGWPVLSGTARVAGRVPWLKAWLQSKESVILSAEQQMLKVPHPRSGAFWMSVALNFVAHGLAIAEVYLILLLMGSKDTVAGALMLEALTKLINAIGAANSWQCRRL